MKLSCLICASLLLAASALMAAGRSTVVAYSLREASEQIAAGGHGKELMELGEMTRLAGFVYDAGQKDIILVGKVLPEKPAMTMDDLVTGFRAWMVYHEVPLVSIDPTDNTAETRQQVVRLRGHLTDTPWGASFVQADAALKHICLKLMQEELPVRSYRDYFEDQIKARARAEGTEATDISWMQGARGQAITSQYTGQGILGTNSSHCRFWFYATEHQQVVYKDGVFCIKELRLGVRPEETGGSAGNRADSPGERFAEAFSDSFEAMSVHEPLSRLKGLYDLFSVAKAIDRAGLQPVISNLVTSYHVTSVVTPREYPLEELVGVVHRNDGVPQLVHLSGGINFTAELELLQGGIMAPLLVIVTNSRPGIHALTWPLPLGGWKMPNMDVNASGATLNPAGIEQVLPGCHIGADDVKFLLPGAQLGKGVATFDGFNPVGGIRIGHEVAKEEFERGDLRNLKNGLLDSRKNQNLSGDLNPENATSKKPNP